MAPADATIAAESSRMQNIILMCNEIKKEKFYLQDKHITAFINIANSSGRCIQPMAETLFVQQIDHYKYFKTTETDGVQIIFQGRPGIKEIGHFICVHYVFSKQTVYIYDSLYNGCGYIDDPSHPQNQINAKTRNIINILYPHHKQRVVVRPRTTQMDLKSCGVFAIAYATTALFGYSPAKYQLKLGNSQAPRNYDQSTDLRYHLANIIQNDQLQLFPSS